MSSWSTCASFPWFARSHYRLHRLRGEEDLGPAAVQERDTDSEEADCCDDAPVLGACEALDRALRKAGLRDGAALSVQLFRSHDDVD